MTSPYQWLLTMSIDHSSYDTIQLPETIIYNGYHNT